MEFKEGFVLRPKTTMRIGGVAQYFAVLSTKSDVEEAGEFSLKNNLPLLPLGSGSNTIFADRIDALVVQVQHSAVTVDGNSVTVGAGKNLAMLINELASQGLDLSLLAGIPGTIGGAIFGNAGQGPNGVWIDSYVESVTVYEDGAWNVLSRTECEFAYRESRFKKKAQPLPGKTLVIWEVTLHLPSAEPAAIKEHIEVLLKKRIETQPHLRTAGSCFKAVGDVPAWQLIDAVGLRGYNIGGIEISSKHANFLLNTGEGTYDDAVKIVEEVQKKIPEKLEVEMRFIQGDGRVRF